MARKTAAQLASVSAGLSYMIISLLLLARLMPHTSLTCAATVCPEHVPLGLTGTEGREIIFYIFLTKAQRFHPTVLTLLSDRLGVAWWGNCFHTNLLQISASR